MTGIERIRAAFEKNTRRHPSESQRGPETRRLPSLMTHAVCGYPDLSTSERLMRAMTDAGSDIIEAQIPFSDPSADGPAIVAANHGALASGATTASCLDMLARLRDRTGKPIIVMSYLNPLLAFGIERLAGYMVRNGLDGVIVPDCPEDEPEYRLPEIMADSGLAFVPLIAPSTGAARARELAARSSSPFIYAVMRLGVTGRATQITGEACERLAALRDATGRRVAAGFGLGERAQMEALAGYADCAIVGSAALAVFNRARGAGQDGVGAVGDFVRKLRGW